MSGVCIRLAILLPIQQYCEYCYTVQLATQIVLQHCACKYDKYDTTVPLGLMSSKSVVRIKVCRANSILNHWPIMVYACLSVTILSSVVLALPLKMTVSLLSAYVKFI